MLNAFPIIFIDNKNKGFVQQTVFPVQADLLEANIKLSSTIQTVLLAKEPYKKSISSDPL